MTDTRRCFKFLSLLINYKVNIEPCEWVGMSFLCPFVGYLLSKATLINIDLSHRIKNDFVCCTCILGRIGILWLNYSATDNKRYRKMNLDLISTTTVINLILVDKYIYSC